MNAIVAMLRPARILMLAAFAVAAALALSGCTITSDQPLVRASEGSAPLPDAFTFYPYRQSPNGYVPNGDGPLGFVRHGAVYTSTTIPPDSDRPIDARFIPIGNGIYLMAATVGDEPGTAYGFARYADGVLALAMSPEARTAAAIRRERRRVMPGPRKALAGLSVDRQTSAITVTTRAALDYLGGMYAAGRLPLGEDLVGYVSLGPETPPPARLVRDGRHWIQAP